MLKYLDFLCRVLLWKMSSAPFTGWAVRMPTPSVLSVFAILLCPEHGQNAVRIDLAARSLNLWR
jgi:hypothetical protein